jgi:hypothetical protein
MLLLALLIVPGLMPSPARAQINLPPERPHDPPGVPADSQAIHAASLIVFGRFVSIQVNVNGSGANIVGDAANEPSIAVDPGDHHHMAIGWRQFDTVRSDFRQAGFGYTTNGGLTWTAGKVQPGAWRTDPVLAVDADGDFFYGSGDADLYTQLFPSTNHGMTWGSAVESDGGDKQWMTFDRTDGPGRNYAYQAWNTSGNWFYPSTFNRSIDDGATFQAPSLVSPPSDPPIFGTLDVGPDGTLYVAGVDENGAVIVSRSADAGNGLVTPPTFTTTPVDLGGWLTSGGPNPQGLLGQVWIAVDRSNGPRAGWVYVLSSVRTPTDPLDVQFVRSTDGGVTWSAPLRINDDPTGNRAFQWFGTMSVSPDGRIDAVWNDTRGSSDSTMSALYYSYSTDGGTTWSLNERASPTWNSTVGFPKQKKIGDYYHMASDAGGADLAYAATFNNEEDVYYLRLGPPVASVATDPGAAFQLHPGTPNPFRSSTTIRFDVPPGGARVGLDVLDPAGRRVASLVQGFRNGGTQTAVWNGLDRNGRPAPPGVYLCRYEGGGRVETRRLALVK